MLTTWYHNVLLSVDHLSDLNVLHPQVYSHRCAKSHLGGCSFYRWCFQSVPWSRHVYSRSCMWPCSTIIGGVTSSNVYTNKKESVQLPPAYHSANIDSLCSNKHVSNVDILILFLNGCGVQYMCLFICRTA